MANKTVIILTVVASWIIMSLAPAFGVPEDDFGKGVALFEVGDFDKAYPIFKQVFEALPSDPEVNFYLGRAAFETGDYESAIMAFDRVLIVNPSANRVKLEMARAYQKLGLTGMARLYCNEVLQSNPPPAVVANVERFLAYVDRSEQQHSFKGSVSVGVDFDDNVYASPLSRTIDTILGDVVLTGDSAGRTSDQIYTTTAELNHSYKFRGSGMCWKTSAAVYGAKYDHESALDTLYLVGTSGPEWHFGKYKAGFEFLANHLSLDGSTYQNAYGVNGIFGFQATPKLYFDGNLIFEKKDFDSADRDARRVALCWDVVFPMTAVWWDVGAAVERWDAESGEYSFNRYAGKVKLRRQLSSLGVTLSGSYEFRHSDYDASAVLFDDSRQDQVQYAMAGIEKNIWQPASGKGGLVLNLSYVRTVADSNIDLYEYRKNEVYSSLTYRF